MRARLRIENHYLNVEWLHWTCQPNCVTIVSPHIIQYHTTQTLSPQMGKVEWSSGWGLGLEPERGRSECSLTLYFSTQRLISKKLCHRLPSAECHKKKKFKLHCFCLGRTRGRRGEAETGRHPSIIEQGLKKGEYLCPPWSLIPLS